MKSDFTFSCHGNVWMLQPITAEATAWTDAHLIIESWQYLGRAIAIDQHFVDGIAEGIQDAGLTVERA